MDNKNVVGSAKITDADKDMKDKIKDQLEESEGSKLVSIDDKVNFKIKYPKEWLKADGKTARRKLFKDGDVLKGIHILEAENLKELGIGEIVA